MQKKTIAIQSFKRWFTNSEARKNRTPTCVTLWTRHEPNTQNLSHEAATQNQHRRIAWVAGREEVSINIGTVTYWKQSKWNKLLHQEALDISSAHWDFDVRAKTLRIRLCHLKFEVRGSLEWTEQQILDGRRGMFMFAILKLLGPEVGDTIHDNRLSSLPKFKSQRPKSSIKTFNDHNQPSPLNMDKCRWEQLHDKPLSVVWT